MIYETAYEKESTAMARKTFSLLLVFMLMFTFMPQVSAADPRGERTVHLHAGADKPTETLTVSTVYVGDTANVFLAVDNPNKGGTSVDSEGNTVHDNPQYDMNGYTVKIYFDPIFFDFAPTENTSSSAPIDYTYPDKFASSGTGGGYDPDDHPDDNVTDKLPENLPETAGYYVYSHGSGSETVNGKAYKTAYATIFFGGKFMPEKESGVLWFNLLALPLKPLIAGSTDVFIDVETADTHTLELFAKNVDDRYPPTFNFSAINGGRHHINIKDKLKPAPPVADPVSGSYMEAKEVTLTAEDDCKIYWSTSANGSFELYTVPVSVERSMDIYCYAERADGKKSNTVSYEYKILPKAPVLYDGVNKERIQNVHTEYMAYDVYVSDKDVYDDIEADSEIYYTFTDISTDEIANAGDDPEQGWVKLPKGEALQKIHIDKNRTVRLVTQKSSVLGTETSDVAWYYLAIKPDIVTADPDSTIFNGSIEVELSCETPDAEIYYTINGDDPRVSGIPYTIPLVFNSDTTLRAVALYDGQWGDTTSYWYVCNEKDDYAVDAFYPSGVYEGEVNVTLTPANSENTVWYSTVGGTKWKEYKETLVITKDTEILTKAQDKEGNYGEIYSFTYTVKPLPPMFAPESTQFTNANKISVFCPERTDDNYRDYELIYTLDGSNPITSDTAITADSVSDSAEIQITGYTVVTAVVRRDKTTWSNVVTHSYDIVVSKPVRPLTTLLHGYYTREIGSDPFTTQFVPVPDGTTIYYTISNGDEVAGDPVPNTPGTIQYIPGTEIDIKGKTIIKAVAVNSFGAKSDIGIFEYMITPQAPVAAPSATVGGDKLPVVPVKTVAGSRVIYEVGGFENSFTAEDEQFYIDTNTGEAYKDAECTQRLGRESDKTNTTRATLEIRAELDGVSSEPNRYIYVLGDDDTLAAPYADKPSGTYNEINYDGNNNWLCIKLYSLNKDAEIQYMEDNSGEWIDYNGTSVNIKKDTVLQLRAKKGDKYSAVTSYVYDFVPLAPIITLPSGRYSKNPVPTTKIVLDSRVPTDVEYTILYRANGDKNDDLYNNAEREIDKTMSFKAYVLNEETGKKSANTIHYYIIESGNVVTGSVYTAHPYEVNPGDTRFIGVHLLDDEKYNEGIKLYTQNKDAKIKYYYSYTKADGTGTAATETYIYDNAMPIYVTSSMKDITITAWLVDSDGTDIMNSQSVFKYVFTDLLIPKTSLGESGEVKKGTKYTIRNDYDGTAEEKTTAIYYTVNGTDPADPDNNDRKLYDGDQLTINADTTVKTVYHRACGKCGPCKDEHYLDCTNEVYGEVGRYKYSIKSKGGSSGGGGSITVDKTRKYTKDIFGDEHPTHIGYIKGYPDGSVQPEGYITREEMAAILYRITNHAYEAPFATTGEVFPDVSPDRWSVKEIEYMADKQVIIGYPDGEFKPSANLTRAEFAALIQRFTGKNNSSGKNPFGDLEREHWAYKSIIAVVRGGLMQGYEDHTFRPENPITRAEVMTTVNKILGRCPLKSYVKGLQFNPFNDLREDAWYYVEVLEATITHDYWLDKEERYEYKWENWK